MADKQTPGSQRSVTTSASILSRTGVDGASSATAASFQSGAHRKFGCSREKVVSGIAAKQGHY